MILPSDSVSLESADDQTDYKTSLKKMFNIGIHKEREDAESDEICLERSSSRLGHSSIHSLNEASCQHSTDTDMESAICKPESVPLSFTSEIKSDNCITTICEFVKRIHPSFDLIQIYNHCTKQWQSTPSQLTQKLLSLLSLACCLPRHHIVS